MNTAYIVSTLMLVFVLGIFILIDEFTHGKKHNRRKK